MAGALTPPAAVSAVKPGLNAGVRVNGRGGFKDLAAHVGVNPKQVHHANLVEPALGPHYRPLPRSIFSSLRHQVVTGPDVAAGVAAHELGHARVDDLIRNRFGDRGADANIQAANHGQGIGALAGVVGGAMGNKWLAGAGTVAHLPLLANEIAASHFGGKGMLRASPGRGALNRTATYLSAYRGVPTYLASAAAPGVAYGARKLIDHWRGVGEAKQAFVQELKDTWNGLGPNNQLLAGLGGAITAGAALNQLRPRGEGDSASTTGNLLAGGLGLGLGAYGMAGGKVDNILPTLQHVFAGGPKPGVSQPAPAAAPAGGPPTDLLKHPALQKYMNPDGSVRFQDVVKAPDSELQANLALLQPDQRAKLRSQLAAFRPSLGQRLGAKAMGIDLEGQRARFDRLLA